MESLSTATLFEHLLRIEKELADLKRALLKSHDPELARRNPGSLRGIWQGVTIDEEDFAAAKASLNFYKVIDHREERVVGPSALGFLFTFC